MFNNHLGCEHGIAWYGHNMVKMQNLILKALNALLYDGSKRDDYDNVDQKEGDIMRNH